MNTRKWTVLIVVMLALSLMLGACEAAENDDELEEPGLEEPGLEEEEPLEGETAAEFGEFGVQDAEVGMALASNLMGMGIDSLEGEELGTIQDLLLDLSNGNILFAPVTHGGFLDVGDETVMVPLGALQWNSEEEEFTLTVEETVFEQWPELEAELPVVDPNWDDDVAGFWEDAGVDIFWDPANEMNTVTWASDVIDSDIVFDGEIAAGNVDDLVVELSQSRAKYVLLSFDEGLVGEEVRAVPFSAFNVSIVEGELLIEPAIDLDTLAEAPSIGSDPFDDVPVFNEAWDNDLDVFWEELGYPVAANIEEVD
ncbi:MAG TPA: PRC-barrel domain-containing protein [Anaerolineae bacterium]